MAFTGQSKKCSLRDFTAKAMNKKIRLDNLLVERNLAANVEKARALILARKVKINDAFADKAGLLVAADAPLQIMGGVNPYVSRGGLKLRGALDYFQLDVTGRIALDVGASTGGFTDCLLQAGARRVIALDVAYGQLAWKLREDKRVTVIERTNIRYYDGAGFPEKPDLTAIDASFISLKVVIPPVLQLLTEKALLLALIKPQFEARREEIGPGGIVRDDAVHGRIVEEMAAFCRSLNLQVEGTCPSPLLDPKGNAEFFILAGKVD